MTTPRKKGLVGRIIALKDRPWRFLPDDTLFVRGWPQDYPVKVVRLVQPPELAAVTRQPVPEQMANMMTAGARVVPHYEVEDHLGGTWLVSQLQLSRSPITERTGYVL